MSDYKYSFYEKKELVEGENGVYIYIYIYIFSLIFGLTEVLINLYLILPLQLVMIE